MNSRNKKITALVVFLLVIIIVALFVLNLGVSADISETKLKVSGFWYTREISYSDIEAINIYTGIEYGERVSGMSYISIYRGTYKNEEFGEYKCAVNKDVESCIVVRLKSGEYYVFNSVDRENTLEIYEFIKQRVNE